jgi:hypothetical protein
MIDEIPIIGVTAGQLMDLALGALDDVKPGVAGSYITSKLAEKPRLRFK